MTDWVTISVREETRDELKRLCNEEEMEYDELERKLIETYKENRSGWLSNLLG